MDAPNASSNLKAWNRLSKPSSAYQTEKIPLSKNSRARRAQRGALRPFVEVVEPAVLEVRAENERVDQLEAEVQSLREELNTLKEQIAQFRQQFE